MKSEICTLTLRLYPEMARRFVRLANKRGYAPASTPEGRFIRVDTYFQNKTLKHRLLRAWADDTLDDPEKNQKFLML